MSAYLSVVNYMEYKVNFRLFDKVCQSFRASSRRVVRVALRRRLASRRRRVARHALKISFYIILIHELCHNFVYHFYTISVRHYVTIVNLRTNSSNNLYRINTCFCYLFNVFSEFLLEELMYIRIVNNSTAIIIHNPLKPF